MRVDRDAAPVVGHRQEAAGIELNLDEGGVPGHRLVHAVVDDLGKEVVQRLGVGAADKHARPPADRLQTFQNLDMSGTVGVAGILGLGGPTGGAHERIGPPLGTSRRGRLPILAQMRKEVVVHEIS